MASIHGQADGLSEEDVEEPIAATASEDGIRCRNDTECPDQMCCVHNPLSRPEEMSKRFIFDEYEQYDHGYCRKASKFNESCWPLGNKPQLHIACISSVGVR